MITVENLTKTFADPKRGPVHAVDHISFEVRDREIFGLLGPNGAGKTTTLRILSTILTPSEGTATVAGLDVRSAPEQVRRKLGFLSGDMGLYHRLSARETLTFFARLNGYSGRRLEERVREIMALLHIDEFADARIDKLSTGMRQRVAIGRCLVHDPPVLILDEPTSGLDVPTARVIESFILEARNAGKCILLSTHLMEEAEFLCDRMAVIHEGKIKIVGTMAELREATGKERLREIFLDLLSLDGQFARRSGHVA
jgi:sodium transport system ATP-binding protein